MLTSTANYKIAISAGYRQSRITGTITLPDSSVINVTDDDILADSLYIDEMIVPGEDLAIGGAITSEMGVKLINPTINPSALSGAEIDLDYGIITGYEYHVGEMFEGGIIAYILQSGDPGYDAAETNGIIIPADLSALDESYWFEGTPEFPMITPLFDIGKGSSNTDIIASYDDVDPARAAVIAKAFSAGGYDDWFLPSGDELEAIMANRAALSIPNADYWSSTDGIYGEGGWNYATFYDYSAGALSNDSKMNVKKILPVRSFSTTVPGPNAVWEDIPLGIYNVVEPKRTGIYIDIKALDNLRRSDSMMWIVPPSNTCEDNIIAAAQTVSYKPTGSVANSVSSSDKLQITVNHQLEGSIKLYWVEYLYQNTTDDLSVSITPHVFPKYTMVDIKIYLAKTTPGKNTAALIQTAIRAMAETYPGYSLDTVVCTALGNWDTTTTAPEAYYLDTLTTQYVIATASAEFDTYANHTLQTSYNNYVSSHSMIIWMCQINSTFARMSRSDQLEVLPLHKASADRTITKAERYKTYVSDSTVKVTAVQMTINGVVHAVGTTGLTMELSENPFMTGLTSAQIDTALTNILNDITLAEYKPFEMEFIGDPTLQPGDWIVIEDAPTTGGDPTTLITHSTWHYRGKHILRGVGRTTATIEPVSQVEKSVGALKAEMYTGITLVSSFSNGWSNFDASLHTPAGYWKIGNMVYLQGLLKNSGSVAQVMFTLPVGYRPLTSARFGVNAGDAFAAIEIQSDGDVSPINGSNGYFSLNGICFRTD